MIVKKEQEDVGDMAIKEIENKVKCSQTFVLFSEKIGSLKRMILESKTSSKEAVIAIISIDVEIGHDIVAKCFPIFNWEKTDLPYVSVILSRQFMEKSLTFNLDKEDRKKIKESDKVLVIIIDHETVVVFET